MQLFKQRKKHYEEVTGQRGLAGGQYVTDEVTIKFMGEADRKQGSFCGLFAQIHFVIKPPPPPSVPPGDKNGLFLVQGGHLSPGKAHDPLFSGNARTESPSYTCCFSRACSPKEPARHSSIFGEACSEPLQNQIWGRHKHPKCGTQTPSNQGVTTCP